MPDDPIADAPSVDDLLDLLREFVWDDDDCHYDHHGYCQQHSLGERPCPHERAKVILHGHPEGRQVKIKAGEIVCGNCLRSISSDVAGAHQEGHCDG